MNKSISLILTFAILLASFQSSFAARNRDWNAVKDLIGGEVAVKIRGGKIVYGVLRGANDDELQIQIADRRIIAAGLTNYRRGEIEKVWRARLRFGGRQIGKGALIGAGAGAAAGAGVFLGTRKDDDDGLAGAIIPLGAIYGAGIGAVVGIFSKKTRRRTNLIYGI